MLGANTVDFLRAVNDDFIDELADNFTVQFSDVGVALYLRQSERHHL